ncbi:hypothetical protein HELRODRAFT_154743 [Helobdella robusta]|uniref:Methyltransferase type 11 domain-containing protein n=1 Tax=Helobdella robusta TaxID=6412 RepID=T1ELF8_HELRO|nr:hypothetical protein HELRODRAFT_154743 [Helobdella robusta]ESO04636.1 hypothetical protein HELRODRAFT_154743 [Helobdella robusta]
MSELFLEHDHSELYRKYRPKYPKEIFEIIDRKLTESTDKLPDHLREEYKRNKQSKWRVALDVACGTGFATLMLPPHFQSSYGIDASEAQIHQAKIEYGCRDPSRVTFLCDDALNIEKMFQRDSVDLIIICQAVHWLERGKFFKICQNVLRPGGMLVLIGYAGYTFDDERLEEINKEFILTVCKGNETIMNHFLDKYESISIELKKYFPNSGRCDSYMNRIETSITEYVGYLRSCAVYRNFKKSNPDLHPDTLDDVIDKSGKLIPIDSPVKASCEYFMIVGVK